MKKIYSAIVLVIIGLLSFQGAFAAQFLSPSEEDPNVTVGTSGSYRNLYTAGANVTVNGTISGDLVVAGSMLTIDGQVEDDVMAAGGTLLLNSPVGGDARIAGGNITITGTIGGDLLVGGGNVVISESATIGGDLIIGAGNVVVNAPVRGSVRLGGGTATLNSRIEGEVFAHVSEKLTFGSQADIPSRVSYKSPREATFQDGSSVPNAQFTRLEQRDTRQEVAAILTAAFLIKLLAWIAVGWLWMHFRRRRFMELAEAVRSKPWVNLGVGLAVLVVIPVAILLLLLLVVGYYAALIVFLTYVLMVVVVNLLSALVVGELILRYLNRPGEGAPNWQIIVLGVVVWHLVGFIPVVGWVIKALVFLVVFGAAARILHRGMEREQV